MSAEIERFKAARDKREKTMTQWAVRIVELEFEMEEQCKTTRHYFNLFKSADKIFSRMPFGSTLRQRWEAAKKEWTRT